MADRSDDMIATLCALAIEGGRIAMRHYGEVGEVQAKADSSPLTAADLEVDQYLCEGLAARFPGTAVVTEERAATHAPERAASRFFLVDPIDGTKEFIQARGEFTINIALIEDRRPVAGVVCAPAIGRLFAGAAGAGAFEMPATGGPQRPLSLASPDNEALVVVASRSHLTPETQHFLDTNRVGRLTNAGSSLKFCLLAAGEADLYPRFGPTMEWDTAAGHAVLAAAGGFVEEISGRPLEYGKPGYRNPFFIAYTPGTQFKRAA
ncbi:MAG: 3'(2'),5'-bisphosphate nucleotidase CysQ [Alphaproteobacteria bacterium]|nr:MAG: 3'(2'),5'-bisphosphate nucleotidase CysQ [Alphaproteobacteria bacterium]